MKDLTISEARNEILEECGVAPEDDSDYENVVPVVDAILNRIKSPDTEACDEIMEIEPPDYRYYGPFESGLDSMRKEIRTIISNHREEKV